MERKTSASNGSVHTNYEDFINSYKMFIMAFSRLHIIDSSRTDFCKVRIYVAAKSMGGV
jgi:hypothetical protein